MFFKRRKQIREIINTLNKVSSGDLEQEVRIYSGDDMAKLADAVNSVIVSLKDKIFALEKETGKIQTILTSMVEGVIVVDKTGNIVSINPTVEKIFNVAKKATLGKFFLEAIRNNDVAEIINNVLKKGKFISQELVLSWPVQKIFQINASPILEGEGISGCLLVIHDITEIRRLETMRRDFVANVSHELKTPLTSIKGFVETLLEGALKDKENSRHFLEIIQDHANRLNALVNDLLDLSHLESGEMRLEKEELNFKNLVDDCLASFKSQLKKRSILAKNDLPPDLLRKGDRDRLSQVLTNLIDNAIKFNREKGFLKIYSQDLGDKIKIVVEDSGIGIPAKDIPRIFERFYRVDKARSRELGGTGLGLSIVKHIVELHNGEVEVESTEGLGSKFFFTLPK